MFEKIMIGIFIAVIFLIGLIYYRKRKGLFSPGFIMIVFWSFMLTAALILDDGMNGYVGYWWILFAIIFYACGYNMGVRIKVSNKKLFGTISMNKDLMEKLIKLLGAILTIYYGIQFIQNGGVLGTAKNAYEYYTGENSMSFLGRVLNQVESMLMYALPFWGGQYFCCETNRKKRLMSIVAFVPALLSMLISSMKLGFLTAIMVFVIGYITASIYSGKRINYKFYFELLRRYWWIVVVFVFLMIFALTIRMGLDNQLYVQAAIRKFYSYAFGSPAAFNYWLKNYNETSLELGINTFMTIFNVLGVKSRVQGVYTESYTSTTLATNVYTAFRGVILDFGTIGGLLFLLLLGVIAGVAMKKYKKTASIMSFVLLSMSYLFILYSFAVSPYAYMNMTILFPLIGIFDLMSQRIRIKISQRRK